MTFNHCYFVSCSIRQITAEVGAAVLRAAVAEELAEGHCDVGPKELKNMSKVCVFSTYYLHWKLHTFLIKQQLNEKHINF
jgi:hypothetical protein